MNKNESSSIADVDVGLDNLCKSFTGGEPFS